MREVFSITQTPEVAKDRKDDKHRFAQGQTKNQSVFVSQRLKKEEQGTCFHFAAQEFLLLAQKQCHDREGRYVKANKMCPKAEEGKGQALQDHTRKEFHLQKQAQDKCLKITM